MYPATRPAPGSQRRYRLTMELLESRVVPSLLIGSADDHDHDHLDWDDLDVEDARGSGPAIRIDLVALHEIGHSLGLDHSANPNSIMYAYYNPNYNLANFASDPIVPLFRSLYSNVNTSRWKDAFDPNPGNGRVEITFSFMPDGARMDSGTNTLFATLNARFGSPSVWQPIFVQQLSRWASVSNGKVSFVQVGDGGQRFNAAGAFQDDARFGDIRIGSHRFDGAGKVLAHAYFPPPNGYTAAGDVHFDNAENWVLASSSSSSTTSSGGGRGGASGGLRGRLELDESGSLDSMPAMETVHLWADAPAVRTLIVTIGPSSWGTAPAAGDFSFSASYVNRMASIGIADPTDEPIIVPTEDSRETVVPPPRPIAPVSSWGPVETQAWEWLDHLPTSSSLNNETADDELVGLALAAGDFRPEPALDMSAWAGLALFLWGYGCDRPDEDEADRKKRARA